MNRQIQAPRIIRKSTSYVLLLLVAYTTGCQSSSQNQETGYTGTGEVNAWYEKMEWLGETKLVPDTSIDRQALFTHFHQNPDRWSQAFAFLNQTDLDSIPPGEYELDGRNLFVKVTEYQTRDNAEIDYESHRDYTDIQYVVSGEEYIGFRDRQSLTIKTPYIPEKDIEFYQEKDEQNLLARPGTFFIFFPHNAHRMALRIDESSPIKKVVIKVKND